MRNKQGPSFPIFLNRALDGGPWLGVPANESPHQQDPIWGLCQQVPHRQAPLLGALPTRNSIGNAPILGSFANKVTHHPLQRVVAIQGVGHRGSGCTTSSTFQHANIHNSSPQQPDGENKLLLGGREGNQGCGT
jgi:hypothetical protein